MNQATAIVMDRREPTEVFDGFVKLGNPVTLGELKTGDYSWSVLQHLGEDCARFVEVLVERASWSNLLEKMSSGELAAQVRRMVDREHVKWERLNYLLIEGDVTIVDGYLSLRGGHWARQSIDTRWKYSSVQFYLLTLQLAGVMLVFSPKLQDTARTILQLYEYTRKEEHDALTIPYKPVQPSLQPPSPEEVVLTGIPGIGVETARALLKEAGSIGYLITLLSDAPDRVARVPGVGPSRIRTMRSVIFGEHHTQYLEEKERLLKQQEKIVRMEERRKKKPQ